MKIVDIRKDLKQKFRQSSIDPSDVDFLMSKVLGVRHTELVLIDEITLEQSAQIYSICERRLKGEPVDRIFNNRYFYGLNFKINKYVLSPRADTEILVERALRLIVDNNYKSCLDMCTGSGAISIAVNKFSKIDTTAVDVSNEAIKIAKENAKLNDVDVKFIHSNMFENVKKKFDIILSNPPYIETGEIEMLDDEVKNYDPHLALDGGVDGLEFYRILARDCKNFLNENGCILLEIGNTQAKQVHEIFKDYKFINKFQDYGGNDRVLEFKKEE